MASIMVGLGAAMPTYKEAQGFSPSFYYCLYFTDIFCDCLGG